MIRIRKEFIEEVGKEKSKLDRIVFNIRLFWWKYVIYTLTTGILALFIASMVLDKSITISVMNSWVGIILGLVATVIGIISMILSFYNLDQSIKTQDKTLETINNIKKEIIEYVDKTSKETQEAIKKSSEKNMTIKSEDVISSFKTHKGKGVD